MSTYPESAPRATVRAFKPGPGFVLLVVATGTVIVMALAAAVLAALGARDASAVLGGAALVVVGLGLLAVLRVPARSVVVNAPRLRLARARSRAARRRAAPGEDALAPLVVPGTDLVVPEPSEHRELRTLDVVSGPVTTALATTDAGRRVDETLAGTTLGEGLVRVFQLLVATLGFILLSLGLASILGQVLS